VVRDVRLVYICIYISSYQTTRTIGTTASFEMGTGNLPINKGPKNPPANPIII
jgi:hypothetical protein